MAKISFNDVESSTTTNPNQVQFFSLKGDGDEAIVRIMHDTVDSFDLMTIHTVQVGKSQRKISCLRNPREPLDNCPLCKAGSAVQQRLYIHMIQYVRDDTGAILAESKVWERSAQYARTLSDLLDNYGPLSDCIFRIKRNGAAGDINTSYAIMYAPPAVYKPEMYPKVETAFAEYSVLGTIVMDKSFPEMNTFVATGEFPALATETPKNTSVRAAPVAPVAPVAPIVPNAPTYNSNTFSGGPANNFARPATGAQTNGFTRPVRNY